MKKIKIKPPPNWEDTPQSFERFERLAKALMTTPKKVVDKVKVEPSKLKKPVKSKARQD